ncbi:RuvC family protein [Anaerosinus massiliensis]|uniref:resolvase n=1 Tax=Massilibacillus massiliensis TaxID=1806837 RepID=UPI000A557D4B|nr:resolvase [Massilibacillus massiliensis]
MPTQVIAIDPGREKCGIAVVEQSKKVLYQEVIFTIDLENKIKTLLEKYKIEKILLGNGTSSDTAKQQVEKSTTPSDVKIELVEEYRTTDAAKIRYWQSHPPRGLRRLIPTGMQVPPVPVDDYVAVILAERYYGSKKHV